MKILASFLFASTLFAQSINGVPNQTVGVSGGSVVNITGSVTVSGCTVSGSQCVVGAPTSTVSLSSIPGIYRVIQIRIFAAASTANNQNVAVTINGDSASHYGCNFINQITTISAGNCGSLAGPATNAVVGAIAGTNATNQAGYIFMDFDSYANTTFNKVVWTQNYVNTGSTSSQYNTAFNLLQWAQTAAVTSLSFTPTAGNFVAGSTLSIYGIQ